MKKSLTDDFNSLSPSDLLEVLIAFKKGNFAVRMPLTKTGIAGKIADTLNEIIETAERMEKDFERISNVVGKEGKIAQKISSVTLEGSWATCVNSVNSLVGDLAQPITEIARVIGAVAGGDLSQSMPTEIEGRVLQGDFRRTAKIVNTMVVQLNDFTSEVTRVTREVGREGKLGGQATVPGVAGTWKDLTDNVNSMASNLTNQVRNIADVTTAVAKGDLSKKITVDVKGEILELKNTINTMVDQLNGFASEVTRVAREVGTEGKLGGQATVPGVAGTWKDLTDNVNSMASNLTNQVRNIADVTTAVANGDLSKKITVDVKGEILELKNTINTMVDQLNGFASEVTRVAREVGTEGKLGGQATVPGVAGTWKDLTDNVNSMASNLTNQVRNIADVTTAVANGNLSKKITVDVKGEILELKNTINTMVDQLNGFASEVTRVAREVGTEGKLGGQATVPGVAGTWKDLTDNVNSMASNLTNQVRNIADVTTAVANGNLSRKITVDVKGEILELKNTINTMVDQLNGFASEVTRVAREVGTEGKLGGQATVPGVAGTWKDLTDNVNSMASNLTNQVRNIADVTTAVAKGDLSKKITVDVKGEILELKNTINTMVDQLNGFASEVTRVAREVGTEGKLGGQATVPGVAGTWKDLTDNVNSMASNLTNQVRNIADVTTAVANGNLSKKITVDVKGEILELKNTINTMVDQLNGFASEVTRVAREVGTEGKLGGQATVPGVAGTWKDLTDNVNSMASNLTNQVRNIAEVTTAVANGNLSKKITVDVKGEILELKNTINTMVDQLNGFASEVTRVAREVGTEGKLGGQATVPGVAGTWKDLTDNVNSMASNLTNQVRNIAEVVTVVANGDLKKKLVLEAKGEIAELSDTINNMIDTLALFADQVTTVAREVGIEGKLGGQARVPGAAGIWRDLTDNVNQLASNLTTQVRAIAEVATAVTKGDLSRSITVEAEGEVAALKDNINEMIRNLKETTRINTEQDWLKTNLAKFTRLLQGQRDLVNVSKLVLSELAPLVSAQHGTFYINEIRESEPVLKLLASYAYQERKHLANRFKPGEGLIGQCVIEKERIVIQDVPADYIKISSGLGEAPPLDIAVIPVLFEGEVMAVVELASFHRFTPIHLNFLDQLVESIGIVLNTIAASMRTEELLIQSQTLTEELRGRQEELENTNKRLEDQAKSLRASEELLKEQREELQQTNEELEEKAKLLARQNMEVETKNAEVEHARRSLEEKAKQLALTSTYKSEFLANMSHELRTPLNSMLILSKLLSNNEENNLIARQIEFAKTIHSSGQDLLQLINDILDLSKIESGKMTVEIMSQRFKDLSSYMDRTFREVAKHKQLEFFIELDENLPNTIETDTQRLQQVIRNLLSNAFKFTEKGSVTFRIFLAQTEWTPSHPVLSKASQVIGFSVIDTGIGIPIDKQGIIFEAFMQADGSTNRKHGGTGLGLSISREIARLLGGEIQIKSAPNQGSSFTLFLPITYISSLNQVSSEETEVEGVNIVNPQINLTHNTFKVSQPQSISDDRERIGPDEKAILIVEDDEVFARFLYDLSHECGYKALISLNGEEGMQLIERFSIQGIFLDIVLPDLEGWAILDFLKRNYRYRHLPVHIISANNQWRRSLRMGAMAHINKPVDKEMLVKAFDTMKVFNERKMKKLLLVDNDNISRNSILEIMQGEDIETKTVETGQDALNSLRDEQFDCMVLDMRLPDMSGLDLLQTMLEESIDKIPVIVYTENEISKEDESQLKNLAQTITIKDVHSPERLLDETSIFLHRFQDDIPEEKRKMLLGAQLPDPILQDKRILIIDDDVRNIFAMISILERHKMQVLNAENGKDGIELLQKLEDIDIILMDIMMPEMDGYETMRLIRKINRFRNIPIIAVTAKAMKGDKEKCLEAGASDYITKPVDIDQLLSILRIWLYN